MTLRNSDAGNAAVSGELDRVVASVGDLRQHADEVLAGLLAQGVELQGNVWRSCFPHRFVDLSPKPHLDAFAGTQRLTDGVGDRQIANGDAAGRDRLLVAQHAIGEVLDFAQIVGKLGQTARHHLVARPARRRGAA